MSKATSSDHSSTVHTQSETHHAKEDALTDREFVRLLKGARELKDPFDFEARLCAFLGATLGLRVGEIAHLRSDWINWRDRTIEIPAYEKCTFGSDGGVCGYCRSRALDRLTTNNLTIAEARAEVRDEFDASGLGAETVHQMALSRRDERNITYERAVSERWNPKTASSARAVPFDFNVRCQMVIEEFAERYDAFPRSRATVPRRLKAAAEAAGIEGRVYPHALRATAAITHSTREVSPYSLMTIMGWSDLETARVYIRGSDEAAAKEIRSKHR